MSNDNYDLIPIKNCDKYFTRELTGLEFIGVQEIILKNKGKGEIKIRDNVMAMAEVCALAVVNDQNDKPGDPQWWLEQPFRTVLEPCFDGVAEFNGFYTADKERAEVKNL